MRWHILHIAFVLALTILFQHCKQAPASAATEVWCKPEEARRLLKAEYNAMLTNHVPMQVPIGDFSGQTITYHQDVAPLLRLNCGPCHRSGGNGPFPLQSYSQVKKKAKTIKEVLRKRIMPPWMADNHYSDMIDAPTITDHERALIISWIDNGIPEGVADSSTASTFAPAKESADIYVKVANPHTISSNNDTYQCFILDPKLAQEVFVDGISFQSSNPRTIHHIMMYIDTAGVLDTLPPDWDCMKDDIVNALVPIDSWSKGQRMLRYQNSYAYRFPQKTKILLQTHYGDEGNEGQLEQTTVGLHLAQSPPKREIQWAILNNLDIAIPANTSKVETIEFQVKKDMAVLGLVPHLHFVGRMVECYAMTANCRKINLLKIPEWDYLWQSRFMFRKPQIVPKGSTIYMNVLYDNTSANPLQPNDPIIDIHYDNYSIQEMMVLCIYYSEYESGDENNTIGYLVR